jgi:hypothetical protein
MRTSFLRLFLWSWTISLPIVIAGTYLTYRGLDRFFTYNVQYHPGKTKELDLDAIARYEISQLVSYVRVKFVKGLSGQETSLKSIHLVVPEANLAKLEAHMPQSGFEYVKGRMIREGRLNKVKIKYRGDTYYRWAWDKKSLRFKTSKKTLFEGVRSVNLLAPRTEEQLNNYLAYRLANMMGILAPRTELIRLFLNGEDRGVHILVEQIKEMTLRNASLMPGDIYRGELIEKDRFGPGAPTDSLFRSAAVWDKVAINNHFAESSKVPLEHLINLIQQSHLPGAQAQLSQIMDMEAWGKFSAFEFLAQTTHTDEIHNWRMYFDPWRGQFVPIVWDPMGWHTSLRRSKVLHEVIPNSLMAALFQNGDFIRARNEALQGFFSSGKARVFLDMVSEAVAVMEQEIKTDPYLNPSNPEIVRGSLRRLEQVIRNTFKGTYENYLGNGANKQEGTVFIARNHQSLDIAVRGGAPIDKLRINLSKAVKTTPIVWVSYQGPNGQHNLRFPVTISDDKTQLTFKAGLLANITVKMNENRRGTLKFDEGVYQLRLEALDEDVSIISAEREDRNAWVPIRLVDSITPTVFSQLYAPVAINPVPEPITWSGEVTLEGHQILDQPLIIEPGTTVNLTPGATLVLKHRLTAIGTREAPIRFVPARDEQEPWGAIVLSGRGADGSALSHCEMAGGSGLKGDLFEYSAMLSIHDVKDVVISDCQFRDNHVVDDMVHTVYADIRFERVLFKNALSDALDLDISTASISDSHFENSGNDAVDLMTTQASITGSHFNNNGDKGISVGENSQLYAVNNTLKGNLIGVQSKDRSTAVLLNQTFKDNKTGLHAYKKNWRYGEGGVIFLGKSTVSGDGISASAEKRSAIQIFDSYLETPPEGKRVETIAVEHQALRSALKQDFLPSPSEISPRLTNVLQDIPPELLRQASHAQRGNRIDG